MREPERDGLRPGRQLTFEYMDAHPWEETLPRCPQLRRTAMTGRGGRQAWSFPELTGDDRDTVLDYLEHAFPERQKSRDGWRNPFAPQ